MTIQEYTLHKKMMFSIKDFLCKCDQILSFLRIWSHLLKVSLMENFLFLCSDVSCKYFQYNILKLKTHTLLLITSIILMFKGEVKNYARWDWKTRERTTLILPSPSPAHTTIIGHLPHQKLYD